MVCASAAAGKGQAEGRHRKLSHRHLHTWNSPFVSLSYFTHSHLRILEEYQETGPIEALLLYSMQLEDRGWATGLGHKSCHNGGGCFEYWIVSRAAPMS